MAQQGVCWLSRLRAEQATASGPARSSARPARFPVLSAPLLGAGFQADSPLGASLGCGSQPVPADLARVCLGQGRKHSSSQGLLVWNRLSRVEGPTLNQSLRKGAGCADQGSPRMAWMAGAQSHLSFMTKDQGRGTRLLLIGKRGSRPRGAAGSAGRAGHCHRGRLGGAPRSRPSGRGRGGAQAWLPAAHRRSALVPPRPAGQGRLRGPGQVAPPL